MKIQRLVFALIVVAVVGTAQLSAEPAIWETVPDPAPLPKPDVKGTAQVNGLGLYYGVYGKSGPWIVFLHGGLGSAQAWGNQVPAFAARNRVLLIEARGHGRSGWDGKPITYEAMASDVIGVLDALKIAKANIVGWSDGAIVGLIMGYQYPSRVIKLVSDGANTDPDGVDNDILELPPYNLPSDRDERTYKALSPTPERWQEFNDAINAMWADEPHITDKISQIKVPVLVMAGQHDLIKPEHTKMIATSIKGAKLDIVPDAAHFIVWQQPKAFNRDVKAFLGVE